MGSGTEGMHEGILDIVKAMQNLKNKLVSFPSNAFE